MNTKTRLARVRELLQSVAVLSIQAQGEIDRDRRSQVVNTIDLIEEDMGKIRAELEAIARNRDGDAKNVVTKIASAEALRKEYSHVGPELVSLASRFFAKYPGATVTMFPTATERWTARVGWGARVVNGDEATSETSAVRKAINAAAKAFKMALQ